MIEPEATLVIVPRERFSYTERSLESLYENTTTPFKLIYVDGNSPNRTKRYLENQAKEKGFRLIRTEHFLAPNQARNLALPEIHTKYAVFVDNDVVFTPGWLDRLLQCAEETGAWVVGPLYYHGKLENEIIHHAGGLLHIREDKGKRRFIEKHRFLGKPVDKVRSELRREETELIEFHCFLVRSEVFEQIGQFDEKLMSTGEEWDLCLEVRERGKTVYFEPNSIISYVPPPPFAWSDLPFFLLRWSDAWNLQSLNRFREKWNLPEDDPGLKGHYKWLNRHRQRVIRESIRRVFPIKRASWMNENILKPVEQQLNKLLFSKLSNKSQNQKGETVNTVGSKS
ncbi:glycosyltransferase family 2 protein [Argonema galeatum]|uniref:glycosyltransferase family 2 protein n=1 Tax=Argonema galeatum TaxID=2942762 RepID=UPI0020117E9C|nr:glycosyltransferase [Argonema galeatum]MCL1463271.1 glycosyltransferase [Argonema galeatum A003/A1]